MLRVVLSPVQSQEDPSMQDHARDAPPQARSRVQWAHRQDPRGRDLCPERRGSPDPALPRREGSRDQAAGS